MLLPIPGWLISLLTFPGVIIHEMAHLKMCQKRGIPVGEVVFFQIGNPAGYVQHAEPETYLDTLAVSGAPFLLNSFIAVLFFTMMVGLTTVAQGTTGALKMALGLISLIIIWLGFSTGMHAIPSSGDAKNLWRRSKKDWNSSLLALLGFPIAAFIYTGNLLRIIWFDLIYAFGLFYLVMLTTGIA